MTSPYGLQVTESCLICKLRNSSFFCNLPKPALEALEKIKFASAFPQAAVLFVEGQAPRGVYIVCSGRVKLSTTSRDGKTLILRIAQSGEVLGLPDDLDRRHEERDHENSDNNQGNHGTRRETGD